MHQNNDNLRGLRAKVLARHWQTERHAEAVAICRTIADDPESDAAELRATVQEVLNRGICPAFSPAAKCVTRLLAHGPDSALFAARAHFNWVCGRTDDAISDLRSALSILPQQPQILHKLALIELEAGRSFDAFRSSGTALCFDPQLQVARLVFVIAQRLLTNKAVVEIPFAGETLRFNLSGKTFTVDSAHVCGRLEESGELQALHELRGQWPVMVDIGGNVGNHAVAFLRGFRPGKLFIYEVNPRCLPILEDNLARNRMPGCQYEIRPRAVGAARGKLFLPRHDDLNTGLQEQAEGEGESVDVVPLDDELTTADFIKIDVEGMELDVLKGAEGLISRSRPWIYIEVQHYNRAAFDAWMQAHRYRAEKAFEYSAYTNVIAAPGTDSITA
jgi:FkbM family methyltransferase